MEGVAAKSWGKASQVILILMVAAGLIYAIRVRLAVDARSDSNPTAPQSAPAIPATPAARDSRLDKQRTQPVVRLGQPSGERSPDLDEDSEDPAVSRLPEGWLEKLKGNDLGQISALIETLWARKVRQPGLSKALAQICDLHDNRMPLGLRSAFRLIGYQADEDAKQFLAVKIREAWETEVATSEVRMYAPEGIEVLARSGGLQSGEPLTQYITGRVKDPQGISMSRWINFLALSTDTRMIGELSEQFLSPTPSGMASSRYHELGAYLTARNQDFLDQVVSRYGALSSEARSRLFDSLYGAAGTASSELGKAMTARPDQAQRFMESLLRNADVHTRLQACRLAERRPYFNLPAIRSTLEQIEKTDNTPEVREAAKRALGSPGSPK